MALLTLLIAVVRLIPLVLMYELNAVWLMAVEVVAKALLISVTVAGVRAPSMLQ